MATLPFIKGDYIADEFSVDMLAGFDSLVFAAANDGRQVPPGADQWAYFRRANVEAVPAFFRLARTAKISRAVYVSSFYQDTLAPDMIARNAYLSSRIETDRTVLALNGAGFAVCSLRAPHVIGHIPGLAVSVIELMIRYLRGDIGGEGRRFVCQGGSNYISTRSFAEAIAGALERGEPGTGYLVGDQNLTFVAYLDSIRRAMGLEQAVAAEDRDHPVIPNGSLLMLRNMTLHYQPDPAMVSRLGYRRDDALCAIEAMTRYYLNEIVAAERGQIAAITPGIAGSVSAVDVRQADESPPEAISDLTSEFG